jgi:hypothetical protein
MKIIDVRPQQDLSDRYPPNEPIADIFAFGSDTTLIYYWASFKKPVEIDGKDYEWKDLMGLVSEIEATAPDLNWDRHGSTRASRDPSGALLLEAWLHQYKWSGARTLYTPSTEALVVAAMDRGLLKSKSEVYLGNWAGVQRYEYLGVAKEIKQPTGPMRLWHGTSTFRIDDIMELGVLPNMEERRRGKGKKDTVYFSASKMRAANFADQCVKCDNKKGVDSEFKKRYPGKKIEPILLEVVVPEGLFGNLVADEDWMNLVEYEIKKCGRAVEPHDRSQWANSLKEFGQIGLMHGLPPAHIVGPVERPKTVRYSELK